MEVCGVTIDFEKQNGYFFNADCMEGMKRFPDKYFDLAIVDPPYGINADMFNNGAGAKKDKGKLYSTAVKLRKGRLNQGSGKLKNRILNQSDCSWDREPPQKEYFDELFRVSKNQIIWGGNYFNLPPTRGIIVWDKKQPWENFSQVEMAWSSFDKPASIFRMANYATGKIHPTQKPVELYKWLIDKYAQDSDSILDTHVGSASSLIACHETGHRYVGFEIDSEYYQKARTRLEQAESQLNIFSMMGNNPYQE